MFDYTTAAFYALLSMRFQPFPSEYAHYLFLLLLFHLFCFPTTLPSPLPSLAALVCFHLNVLDAHDSGARSRTFMRRCRSTIPKILFFHPNHLRDEIALVAPHILASRFLWCCQTLPQTVSVFYPLSSTSVLFAYKSPFYFSTGWFTDRCDFVNLLNIPTPHDRKNPLHRASVLSLKDRP